MSERHSKSFVVVIMAQAAGSTLQSIRRVVCKGTAFLILKLASIVASTGAHSILANSAVASSSKDSTCTTLHAPTQHQHQGAYKDHIDLNPLQALLQPWSPALSPLSIRAHVPYCLQRPGCRHSEPSLHQPWSSHVRPILLASLSTCIQVRQDITSASFLPL